MGETVLTCGLSVAAKVKHGLFVLGAGGVRTWCQDVVSGRGVRTWCQDVVATESETTRPASRCRRSSSAPVAVGRMRQTDGDPNTAPPPIATLGDRWLLSVLIYQCPGRS